MDLDYQALMGRLMNLVYGIVVYPLGILNLFWIAPTLAVLRWVWRFLTWETNVKGKAVVITGASSGIGEHIAYEFALRGANLVLAARRTERLERVCENCYMLGSKDVVMVKADVQNEKDCKNIIDQAVDRFGTVDILVNNAGVAHSFLLADAPHWSMDAAREVINTTFWGHVYPTYYALPYLRATGGQLLNIISVASFIPFPRQGVYNAAKHAALGFFDTLRAEVGSTVTVTNILPGWIMSEMTEGKFLDERDQPAWDPDLRDEHVGPWPVLPTKDLSKKAVHTALKHERNVVVPFWYTVFLYWRVFAPEIMDLSYRILFLPSGGKPAPTRKIVQMVGTEAFNMPEPGTQARATEEKKMT